MEGNPNHPVMKQLHDEWHKLLGIVMHLQGVTDIPIREEDINSLLAAYPNGVAVVADCRGGGLTLRLMTWKDAEILASIEERA